MTTKLLNYIESLDPEYRKDNSRFAKFLHRIFVIEGMDKFTDESFDGRRTRWGMTERTLRIVFPKSNIETASLSEISYAYFVLFYQKPRCREVSQAAGDEVGFQLFQWTINGGIRTPSRALQTALNVLGYRYNIQVKADGAIGPRTITAMIKLMSQNHTRYRRLMLQLYRSYQTTWYANLLEAKPERNVKFIDGWLNRAAEQYHA